MTKVGWNKKEKFQDWGSLLKLKVNIDYQYFGREIIVLKN